MKKAIKIIAYTSLLVFFLFLLVITGMVIYANTETGKNQALSFVNARINGKILAEDIRIRPFSGNLHLSNLRILDEKKNEIAGVDTLQLNLSIQALLNGFIRIESLTLVHPRAGLEQDEKGRLNLAEVFSGGKKAREKKTETKRQFPRVGFAIDEFTLEKGQFRYLGKSRNLDIFLSGIRIEANADVPEKHGSVRLSVQKGRIENQGIRYQMHGLLVRTRLEDGVFHVEKMKLDSRAFDIQVSGKVTRVFTAPESDLEIKIRSRLDAVKNTFGIPGKFSGNMEITAGIKGKLSSPRARVASHYSGGVLYGCPVESVRMETRLEDQVVFLDTFSIKGFSGMISATGKADLTRAFPGGFNRADSFAKKNGDTDTKQGGNADISDLSKVEAIVAIETKEVHLEEIPWISEQYTGVLNFGTDISVNGIHPKKMKGNIRFQADAENFRGPGMKSPEKAGLRLRGKWNDLALNIQNLELTTGDNRLGAEGIVSLKEKKLDINTDLSSPSLERFLSVFGIRDASGTLDLSLSAQGSFAAPSVDISVNGEKLQYQDMRFGNIRAKAVLDEKGNLEIPHLVVNQPGEKNGARAEITGTAKVFDTFLKPDPVLPFDLSLDIHHMDPEWFYPDTPVTGIFTIDGRITGKSFTALVPLSRKDQSPKDGRPQNINKGEMLSGSLALHGKDIVAKGFDIGRIDGEFNFLGNKVEIPYLKVTNKGSGVIVKGHVTPFREGSLHLSGNPAFDLGIKADPVLLEDFAKGFLGKIQFTGSAAGTIKDFTGNINLNAQEIDLGIQKIHSLSLGGRFNQDRAVLETFEVFVVPDEKIAGSGTYAYGQKDYTFTLDTDGISLEHIGALNNLPVDIKGRSVFDMEGKGNLADPALSGMAKLTSIRVNDKPMADIAFSIDLANKVLEVRGKGEYEIDGEYHIEKQDFSAAVSLENNSVAPYFLIAGIPGFSGNLTGKIQAKGNAALPQEVMAKMDIASIELFYQDAELISAKNLSAQYQGGNFTIPASELRVFDTGKLSISGKGVVGENILAKMEGQVPLSPLEKFTTEISESEGTTDLSLTISGKMDSPDIQADIRIQDGAFTISRLLTRIEKLQGKIMMTPKSLTFDNIRGKMETGEFSISGRADMKGLVPERINLALSTAGLPVNIPDTAEFQINSNLTLEGVPEKTELKGVVRILEGTYYRDINLNPLKAVITDRRETQARGESIDLPFLKNMHLDISLRHENPILIDNNMALLSIKPDLEFHGTLNQPVINGRAEIQSGTITYQNKTFEVKKGTIDFINPYRIDPEINVVSEVMVRKWRITLKVSGTMDALKFEFSSDPRENDQDILSLLLTGKTGSELVRGSGSSNGASPAGMIADLVEERVGENLKNAAGLDEVSVEMNSTEGNENSVKVTIGKELSRRMNLKYSVETKSGDMVQQAEAEYQILDYLLMNGFQDSEGNFGGKLQFRMEFR